MSSRQLRKLQQQQEQQNESESESDSQDSEPRQLPIQNKFAGFISSAEEIEDDDSEEEESQNEEEPQVSTKITDTKPNTTQQPDLDDIILAPHTTQPLPSGPAKPCLRRKPANFDYQAELKQLFKERDMRRAVRNQRKMIMTPGKENWNKNIDYLLDMQILYDNVFSFTMSKGYMKTQEDYMQCVESHDPNAIMHFTNRFPFHIEGLYQVAIYYQLQANYDTLSTILERLLFAFELAFHHQFSPMGDVRLAYAENKYNEIFYKAVFMHIDCLGRKGCMKAALEFTKFLLVMSPVEDHMGAIFLIDYYSLRARKYDEFLEFVRNYAKEYLATGSIIEFPSILYSTALAKMSQETSSEITSEHIQQLQNLTSLEELLNAPASTVILAAIAMYPYIAKEILIKLSPANTLLLDSEPDCPLGDISHISNLYTARSLDLWKAENIVPWLKNAARKFEEVEGAREGLFGMLSYVVPIEKYVWLDSNWFSDEVRNMLPEDIQQQIAAAPRGNLDPNANPLYLFFATLLPWNFLNEGP